MEFTVKFIDCPYVRVAKIDYPALVDVVKDPPRRGKFIYYSGGWCVATMHQGERHWLGHYDSLHRAVFNAKS